MKNRKAIIVGLSSLKLKKKEKKFLIKNKPWGVILFSRNIKDINQAKRLVEEIKECFNDNLYPILIDEEGGSVSRLKKIIDTSNFTAKYFADLYLTNKKKFYLYYEIYINSISSILNNIGININTVPVLDIVRKKNSKIIGDRSYSNKFKIVSDLGDKCIKAYTNNKIATIMKHIPGHGLANLDSHKFTPIIKESKKILKNNDFKSFKNKKTLMAMTAHVIYQKYDPTNTATHSKHIINKIIRNEIKFKNILISDDISMKSLKNDFKTNVIKAFEAGCNIVLHCNGNIKEMNTLAKISPKIDNFMVKKTSELYKFLL